MNIVKTLTDKTLNVAVEGRLDTVTAPQLEAELKQSIGDSEKLILDFAKLEYISSAGLRVMLVAQKAMKKRGELVIRNVSGAVAEVFEITGFSEFLTIE